MKRAMVLLALAALTACGADGEPVTPTRDATITMSNHGISAQTNVGLRQGPLSVSLGLGL